MFSRATDAAYVVKFYSLAALPHNQSFTEDSGSYSCAVRGYLHLHSTAQNFRVRPGYSTILYVAVGVGLCGISAFLTVVFWRRM
ncbi:hypothetical protein MHYP_G00103220 [Metynnis hypsauchen]